MVEQDMSFDTPFSCLETGPWKKRQAHGNGRGVQQEQLVFETKTCRARAQLLLLSESIQGPPEQLLKQSRRSMFVRIGQGGFRWSSLHAQMNQFPQTATQPIADLSQRVRTGQLTKQHGHKLGPATKPLRTTFRTMLVR